MISSSAAFGDVGHSISLGKRLLDRLATELATTLHLDLGGLGLEIDCHRSDAWDLGECRTDTPGTSHASRHAGNADEVEGLLLLETAHAVVAALERLGNVSAGKGGRPGHADRRRFPLEVHRDITNALEACEGPTDPLGTTDASRHPRHTDEILLRGFHPIEA